MTHPLDEPIEAMRALKAQRDELLAALEHLYRLHCDDVFRLPDQHYVAICNAASAIRKARGQS